VLTTPPAVGRASARIADLASFSEAPSFRSAAITLSTRDRLIDLGRDRVASRLQPLLDGDDRGLRLLRGPGSTRSRATPTTTSRR